LQYDSNSSQKSRYATPPSLEFAGAIYHLTNSGNDRQKAFSTDAGRELFLNALARVVRRYGWLCHVYRLPTNRYHPMARIRAARPSLARIFAKGGKKAITVAYEHGYRFCHFPHGLRASLGFMGAVNNFSVPELVSSEFASASAPSGSMAPAEQRGGQDPSGWELTRGSSLRTGCSSSNFSSGTKSQQRAVKAALMKISRVKPT